MATNALISFLWVMACFVLLYHGTNGATMCACATSNLHIRSGAGTSYSVVILLYTGHCLPHDGKQLTDGAYTWLHLDFNGQSVWGASNWLNVQECPKTPAPPTLDQSQKKRQQGNNVQLPGCPRIITRAEWHARPAVEYSGDMPDLPIYVFIHHGAGSECFDREGCIRKVQEYQNLHIDDRGWNDIGYNFIVGEDGNAYEGRGWTQIGAHTLGYNTNGIAICVIGDFTNHVPNDAALTIVKQLIQCGLDNNKINGNYTLKGHRDVGNTECPGQMYYDLIHSWPHFVPGTGLYQPAE